MFNKKQKIVKEYRKILAHPEYNSKNELEKHIEYCDSVADRLNWKLKELKTYTKLHTFLAMTIMTLGDSEYAPILQKFHEDMTNDETSDDNFFWLDGVETYFIFPKFRQFLIKNEYLYSEKEFKIFLYCIITLIKNLTIINKKRRNKICLKKEQMKKY
jgi:hypothetical protein